MDKKTADALKKLLARINENSTKLRFLEEAIERERQRRMLMEEELLKAMEEIKLSVERASLKLSEVNEKLKELEEKITELEESLRAKADRQELKELEAYVELLKPLGSAVEE